MVAISSPDPLHDAEPDLDLQAIPGRVLEAVRARAMALLPPGEQGMPSTCGFAACTDTTSCAGIVLLGYATATASAVLAIDKTSYDGLRVAEVLGFSAAPTLARSRAAATATAVKVAEKRRR
jgi:hypothetical protein